MTAVKKKLTRYRVVENYDYAAFLRRVIRAYSRRVAAGDIEALTALHQLTSTVDTATADAVHGLRAFGYSWTDIATRLGVTRQAAQMRWGDRHDRDRIDDRLLSLGLGITVAQLVSLFADHHPGSPPAEQCPGCAGC